MKKIAIAFCTSFSFFIGLPGCYSEPEQSEAREPRCEPRSTTGPVRLSLDTSAKAYGAIPPCEPIVSFSFMGMSNLRSVNGNVEIIGPEGKVLHDGGIQASLEGPSLGVFRNDVNIDSIDGHFCRALTLDLELLHCRDEVDNRIECPEVRVKQSHVFEDFTVHGADLDVCFDD